MLNAKFNKYICLDTARTADKLKEQDKKQLILVQILNACNVFQKFQNNNHLLD